MGKNNSICVVTTSHPVDDDRIFQKQVMSLLENGCKVFYIVRNCKDLKFKGENFTCSGLPPFEGRFLRLIFLPLIAFFKVLRTNCKTVHFHDSETQSVALLWKLLGKKVIYDIHENYPNQILLKNWMGIFRFPISKIYSLFERVLSHLWDANIVAYPTIGLSYPNRYIIGNYAKFSSIQKLPYNGRLLKLKENGTVLLFYGGMISKKRGICELLKALEYLDDQNVKLILAGPWESEDLKKQCFSMAGWNKVIYLGYLDYMDYLKAMKSCDIGLINFLPSKHHGGAYPNKLYDYMAASLAIVMSNFPHWIKEFEDIAIFVNPEDPKDIADKIRYLIENNEPLKDLRTKSKKLGLKKYSWESESKKLIGLYKKLGIKNAKTDSPPCQRK